MGAILDHIKSGNVTLQHYQDGQLIYQCADGFEFPVPIEDCGSARFLSTDKGSFFMKWITKQVKLIESAASQNA